MFWTETEKEVEKQKVTDRIIGLLRNFEKTRKRTLAADTHPKLDSVFFK